MANEKIPPAPPAPASDSNTLANAIGRAMAEAIKSTRTDAQGLSPEQRERLETPPPAKKWREVPCRSEETGATFTACVVESKAHIAGRITELKNYRHPEAAIVYQSNGGLVPNGMQVMKTGGAPSAGTDPNTIRKQDLELHYLQWRWETFWQADLNRYVGKELKPHLCVTAADFSTSWKEGQVRMDPSEVVT